MYKKGNKPKEDNQANFKFEKNLQGQNATVKKKAYRLRNLFKV